MHPFLYYHFFNNEDGYSTQKNILEDVTTDFPDTTRNNYISVSTVKRNDQYYLRFLSSVS